MWRDAEWRPEAPALIIYDLDGTLVDAFEDIWVGMNYALRRFGLRELPFATVKSYVGDGARMLVRRCLGPEHADRFGEVYAAYLDYYLNNPAKTVRLYEGVAATLAELRRRGVKQAILTNKPDAVTRQTCERLGLTPLLDGIWGELPERPRKPSAEAALMVTDHFGVGPGATWMVGDGPADHAVARAAGMPMIAVTYGLLDEAQSREQRPRAVLDRFDQLLELADGLSAPSA